MQKRLLDHYKRDDDGAYLIEIAIAKLEDFFDPYDPSTFYERDVNPYICHKIMEQIIIFPKDMKVRFLVHLPKKLRRLDVEAKLFNALRHHFEYELLDSDLHLQRRIQKGKMTFAVASMIFILAQSGSFLLKEYATFMPLRVLAEGLYIGGWVTMWHPIQTLLYEWLPLYENKRTYRRLISLDIKFNYL
jgi:hypothetical protein